ncbi:GNAT family N-acetyltransferase [Roseibium litorale]|uniref:GNAT family N-acetyltransferase n=1 Tax=Roseibium litorale TaxID=2803841 RepID=A0ABR9CR52_9HYPH|nr:GNAT family N-acetyltransferase [Roseibium litorale]MBD8892885.1 GNAT family N-acetyltransferase [Roseibium litorale]
MLLPIHIQRRGPLKVASFPDLGLADQGGPVIARATDLTDTEMDALWHSFKGSLTNVDLITFKNIVPVLGPQLNPLYRLDCAEDDQTMLMLVMAEDGEQEVWRRRPVFKEVRQKGKKLTAEGVTFTEARTADERAEVLAFIREQRRLRFQAMGRTNSLEFPGRIGFYQDIADLEYENRNAVFLSLRTETEIVAAIMAFVTPDMINGVLIGMGGEKWHRMSPGVVLFAQAIEWAKENGLKQFSFGTGMQGYKQRFGPQEVPLKRIYLPLTQIGSSLLKLRQLRQAIWNLWRTIPED